MQTNDDPYSMAMSIFFGTGAHEATTLIKTQLQLEGVHCMAAYVEALSPYR